MNTSNNQRERNQMAHSDFMAMKYAFKEQFGYNMIESGHDDLSIQFFRGWTKAAAMVEA